MNYRPLLSSFTSLVLLLTTGSVWAGAGNVNTPCLREQTLLLHVCQGGMQDGAPCSVEAQGVPDCVVVDKGECGEGGTCVIDYTSDKKIKAQISVMLDDDATINGQPENRALTILLCVKRQGESHCFTETYLGDPEQNQLITIPPLNSSSGEEGWSVYQALTTQEQLLEETVNRFLFSAPELTTNPDTDLASAVRTLFNEPEGIPVVTEIKPASKVHFDDHIDDPTGSVLRFNAILRFADK
jgi:hypothetical protein